MASKLKGLEREE